MSRTSLRFATATQERVSWLLKRNCSISPLQLAGLYGSLCLISMLISAYFWSQGATLILPFALFEMAAVGLAFLMYARHAVDRERIELVGRSLVVELDKGGKTERCVFNREWVRVEPKGDDRSLIELSGQGRRVQIGRFVRPELRATLAREIRTALRGSS